ncbi:hypothetical protein [Endozoicomonas ascidiicola]|uniref:hypothetical protein n=1 Tax=Endozoicomonas ascidiicola TaxID=1698521 RepID=UPI0008364FF4|nr:hypothetical protein [Endozoicomonas ascidiicola]
MKLNKALSLMISMPLASQISASLYDAQAMGQGDAGVAVGDYTEFVTNPAHLANSNDYDSTSYSLGAGFFIQDNKNLVDHANDAETAIERLVKFQATPELETEDPDPGETTEEAAAREARNDEIREQNDENREQDEERLDRLQGRAKRALNRLAGANMGFRAGTGAYVAIPGEYTRL